MAPTARLELTPTRLEGVYSIQLSYVGRKIFNSNLQDFTLLIFELYYELIENKILNYHKNLVGNFWLIYPK